MGFFENHKIQLFRGSQRIKIYFGRYKSKSLILAISTKICLGTLMFLAWHWYTWKKLLILKKRVKCKHQKTSSMSGFEQCGQNIAQLCKVGAFEKWPGAFFLGGAWKFALFSPFGRFLKIFGSYPHLLLASASKEQHIFSKKKGQQNF